MTYHPQLHQPILSRKPEPNHRPEDILTLAEFLELLREEEDYYAGEQHNTKLMLTRLRKIFYDEWGWNTELIRGAADVKGRYNTIVVEKKEKNSKHPWFLDSRPLRRYKANVMVPKYRVVTYRENDRVYRDTRAGQEPAIYAKNHQEIMLPEGYLCDIAHVLAGLDAYNHLEAVTPLPRFLKFTRHLFPMVDSNMDIVTWLGDIASSAGDFLFAHLREDRPLTVAEEQSYIEVDAPGSDMLGDIDPYVISKLYNVSATQGMRVSEILEDFYCGQGESKFYRDRRFSIFCQCIGLEGWNGRSFANEQDWLKYYRKQLRDNTTFQVFSLMEEKISSLWLPLRIWCNGYQDVLKLELLLQLFLKSLKELIKKEPTDVMEEQKRSAVLV